MSPDQMTEAEKIAHIESLRETVKRLNRRCQFAEAAANERFKTPGYRGFGRALVAWGYVKAKERVAELEAEAAKLREDLRRALTSPPGGQNC